MADLSKFIGVALANISKITGVAKASIANVGGYTTADPGTLRAYIVGGFSGSAQTNVDGMNPVTEVTTAETALAAGNLGPGCIGSKNQYLYAMGGFTTVFVDTIQRWDSDDDTRTTPSATLTIARNAPAALTDRNGTGHLLGGQGSGGNIADAEKFTYSSETTADNPGADLAVADNLFGGAAFGDSSAGYVFGGDSATNRRQKLTWATDVTSSLSNSGVQERSGGGSDNGTAIYGCDDSTNIPKFTVATEASSTLAATWTHNRTAGSGNGDDGENVWRYRGGFSATEKLVVATETDSLVAGADTTLSTRNDGGSGCSSGL